MLDLRTPFDPARRQWLKAGTSLLAGLLLCGPSLALGGDPLESALSGIAGTGPVPPEGGPGAGGRPEGATGPVAPSASGAVAKEISASNIQVPGPPRAVSVFHTPPMERCHVTYWRDGAYDPAALREIDAILRDYRTEEVREIDRDLIDLLHDLHARLRTDEPYHVICGYRSQATNDKLRRRSRGVASHSLHLDGRAVDLRVPDVPLKNLRELAIGLNRGGVGYYPRSRFVHVDVGDPRTWRG